MAFQKEIEARGRGAALSISCVERLHDSSGSTTLLMATCTYKRAKSVRERSCDKCSICSQLIMSIDKYVIQVSLPSPYNTKDSNSHIVTINQNLHTQSSLVGCLILNIRKQSITQQIRNILFLLTEKKRKKNPFLIRVLISKHS